MLQHGGDVVRQLCGPGLFAAAGLALQPASPAVLKPVSSLAFTLLKMAGATIAATPDSSLPGWGPSEREAREAICCLWTVVTITALVLQAACFSSEDGGSSSSSSSSVEAVMSTLSLSTAAIGKIAIQLNATQMSLIVRNSIDAASSSSDSNNSIRTAGIPSSDSSGAVALVPWLVSLGRCCVGFAQVLQMCCSGSRADMLWRVVAQGTLEARHINCMGAALLEVVDVLPAWLRRGDVSAQRAAAGYSTQCAERVLGLMQETAHHAPQHVEVITVGVQCQQLSDVGVALSSMPVRSACNNPRCSVLDGLSEQLLVVGSAHTCGGCRVARYCCKACQAADWKQHEPACKAMASARAAKPGQ